MITYTTRITLILANLKDYEQLHKNLVKEFGAPNVNKYKAYKNVAGPTEYLIQSDGPLALVNQAVQRVAKSTGKEYYFTLIKIKEVAGKDVVAA